MEWAFGKTDTGKLICAPASDQLMLDAASQTFDADGVQFKGAHFLAKGAETHPQNYFWWEVIVNELSAGRPLLAAYKTGTNSGHAVVITHMRVDRNVEPRPLVRGITVRDPWPFSDNRRVLSLNEATQLSFVAAISLKRKN